MPLVEITLIRGRTQHQLDRLAARISQALQDECDADVETVQIIYHETERRLWQNADYIRTRHADSQNDHDA